MKIHTAVLNQQRLLSLLLFLPCSSYPSFSSILISIVDSLTIAKEEAVLSASVSSLPPVFSLNAAS